MAFSSTTFTTADWDPVLKDFYLGPVRDILNSKTVLLRRLRRDEDNISGRQVIAPLRVGRNEGHGAIGKGGKLPDPQQQTFAKTVFDVNHFYGRIMLPGPEMAESRDDRGAFVRLLDTEITNLANDMKHDLNRQLHGDGSGVLAMQNSGTGTTITVDNPGGYTNSSNGTLYLRAGMVVVGINASDGAIEGAAQTITAVDSAAQTITTGTSLAAEDNDYICKASVAAATPVVGDTSYDNEFMGLRGIFDNVNPKTKSGGLQGLTISAAPWWKATVMANGGTLRPLTLDLLQQAEDQLDVDSDAYPSIWLSNHAQRRRYLDLLEANKRFVNTLTLDGGFKALEYNEVPWVVDKDAVGSILYGYDENALRIFRMGDFFWLDKDGSILSRDADRDMYQATLALYGELGTMNRRAGIAIEDLSE